MMYTGLEYVLFGFSAVMFVVVGLWRGRALSAEQTLHDILNVVRAVAEVNTGCRRVWVGVTDPDTGDKFKVTASKLEGSPDDES